MHYDTTLWNFVFQILLWPSGASLRSSRVSLLPLAFLTHVWPFVYLCFEATLATGSYFGHCITICQLLHHSHHVAAYIHHSCTSHCLILGMGDIENFQWWLLPGKCHDYHNYCCNEIIKDEI